MKIVLPSIFVIQAELLYMAERSDQRLFNRRRIGEFFEDVRLYNLDSATAQFYAELKTALLERFGPREKAARRRFDLNTLGIHDHDLWIAATALQHNLTVVSADSDFQGIAEARPIAIETWHGSSS